MTWFENLFGFRERDYALTKSQFAVDGGRLTSKANGRSWAIGELEMASLTTLRRRAAELDAANGRAVKTSAARGARRVHIVQGDVRKMHAMPEYAGALFQVASQFNALEMIAPSIAPEDGVTIYQHDATQGPACAMAAAPALVFRNYFAPVAGGLGQTRTRQLDGLAEIGAALSTALQRPLSDLWTMHNGYALCTHIGLEAITAHLSGLDEAAIDELRGRLAIAIQRGVEASEPGAPEGQLVTQAFCSALPVAYTHVPSPLWRPFATLVLEAAYEATLLEAAINAARGGSNIVLLTLLGGGAFGNNLDWILAAIERALMSISDRQIDVRIVSYGPPPAALQTFMRKSSV